MQNVYEKNTMEWLFDQQQKKCTKICQYYSYISILLKLESNISDSSNIQISCR